MDVFDLRNRLVDDYARYTRSFIKIADERIAGMVNESLDKGALWPEPLLQLNPTFQPGGTIDDLVAEGILHPECNKIFRIDKSGEDLLGKPLSLHQHQMDAIRKSKESKSYVLTSGTGSGKSLTYIIPIVDHVLRHGSGRGIQAIVVYPMNALANSQDEELQKFIRRGYEEGEEPVRFARYTGQEKQDEREAIRANPPDILLTNYMMLELLLTRNEDRALIRAARGLRFLVFDELHTYRGRQGADVALLIRRCRLNFGSQDMICIGTSATMAAGGTSEDQKREVAAVAQTLFGTDIAPAQVIGETLERATPELDFTDAGVIQVLSGALAAESPPPADYESFITHPLAAWIETTFGVQTETGTGRLIRQRPRSLRGPGSATEELAALAGLPQDQCSNVLRNFLMHGSNLRKSPSSRFPVFAFRLHQFFTRGDTVWSTIEEEGIRYLEMHKLGSKPGEPDKPLYPLVFCRQCGAAYYRVKRVADEQGDRLLPREDRRDVDDDGQGDGYLYLSARTPWPRGEGAELLQRAPAFMKEMTPRDEERIAPDHRNDLPEPVFVNASGRLVAEGEGVPAALIKGNFLFCLEPACGIAYTKTQRSETQKLGTLGVDKRSTATTILAVRALIELQSDRTLNKEARKLLSFTDNRQDASLQSGHFNDFAQVSLLRSALHRATVNAGPEGLSPGGLSRRVFEVLNLDFEDYAADPEVRGPAKNTTNDALRRVIEYYLYRDLQRGWRVTAPNLEDCGLLEFDYEGLAGEEGLLGEAALWATGFTVGDDDGNGRFVETPQCLRDCPPREREELLRTLLDVMRRELAIKAEALDPQKQLDLVEQTKPRLLEGTVWYLEDPNELVKSMVAYPRPRRKTERTGFFISAAGRYGKYVKRVLLDYAPQKTLKQDAVNEIIRFLLLALKRYGIVEQVRSGDVPGYQVNHGALRWIAGTGEVRPLDRTRLLEAGEIPPEVNAYFVECYRKFIDLNCVLEAREHTAQVAADDRQKREEQFRKADLPLLFCSPTMELGVDIAQLNLVNMRNVPPTPANYAQRSGRAGRGGQPALVYTYCAGRSPHDQYYFRQPGEMVSGAVAPPRIDLRNRDLVRSHIHAVWMEIAKPDLGKTLTSVLDIRREEGRIHLPVKPALQKELRNPAHRAAALARANQLIAGIRDFLTDTTWFHDDWTREVFDQIERRFDDACNRWRELYRAALRQRELHHKIILDHSRPEPERAHSARLRAQAESQIRLLTEAEGIYEGDFYSYRYFAAEGFLPGYNFPRLPISAFVPGRRSRRDRNEFVSRPRFLAITEFGPRALVYHEGARYRVYKVNLDFGSDDIEATHNLVTATMKRCLRCGYAHLEQGANLVEVCDNCGAALEGDTLIPELVHLQNVSLKLAQRITCDEEERQRYGYKMLSAYRFPDMGGRIDRKDAEVFAGGVPVMRLNYGDAASLYRINMGWANMRGSQPPGYMLDLERGYWAKNPVDADDPGDAAAGRLMRVVPFVADTKNALIMRFDPPRSPVEMAGLQAAFKEAIQKHFQIEPRELACEAMPDRDTRREILFFEAAEGGAGVLRQLVEDPKIIAALARTALEICHFDPDTLEDLRPDTCGKACYECLLDYANQWDHQVLDRYAVKTILEELTRAECRPAGGLGSRAGRMAALRKQCDSKLEQRWLENLDALLLNPPSDAQYLIESCSTRPDFFYKEYNAAIYIDGPPHDEPGQLRKDEEITRALLEVGYIVVRFHHKDDWNAIFRAHPDIFGVPRT